MDGLDQVEVESAGSLGAVRVVELQLLPSAQDIGQLDPREQRSLLVAHQRVDAAHHALQLLHLERHLVVLRAAGARRDIDVNIDIGETASF